jgi:hypothetical protein
MARSEATSQRGFWLIADGLQPKVQKTDDSKLKADRS